MIPIAIWINGPYAEDIVSPLLQTLQGQLPKDAKISVQLGTAPSNDPVPRQNVWNIQITVKETPHPKGSAGESFDRSKIELYIPGVKDNYRDLGNKGPCPKEDLVKGLVNTVKHELGHEFGVGHPPKYTQKTPKELLPLMDPDRNRFVDPQPFDNYTLENIKKTLKWDGYGRGDGYGGELNRFTPFYHLPANPNSQQGD